MEGIRAIMVINSVSDVREMAACIGDNIKKIIIGRDDTIEMVLAAMISGGHILLEDVPGSGKTMLAKALAKSIDGEFKRIQMTPDLLPADITGINFFNMKTSEFQFVRGPVFSNILIADEINRATPKTQAGLLEAMEERQVTVDGVTYQLKSPFLVIATENPIDTQGVFPLPEAQIDRFAVKLSMKYPDHQAMIDIMKTHMTKDVLMELEPVAVKSDISDAMEIVKNIRIADELVEYVVNIVEKTREDSRIILGISQRGALALISAARGLAAIAGREYVLPDDIKRAAPYVCVHRIILKNSERIKENAELEVMEQIIDSVPVPTEEL